MFDMNFFRKTHVSTNDIQTPIFWTIPDFQNSKSANLDMF